ncbi:MAG: hypothetical protein RIS47_76 [Bacteroidota bacterium]
MQTTLYKTLTTALMLMVFYQQPKAQQVADSLERYLQEAAQHNPTVQQRYSQYQAALQRTEQVGILPDPQLKAGVFLSPMEIISGQQVANFELMQMFPWFGVLRSAKNEMTLMAKASNEQYRDAQAQVRYETSRDWNALKLGQQQIRITLQNLEILHSLERLALSRFRASSSNASPQAMSGNAIVRSNAATSTGSTMGSMGAGGAVTQNSSPKMQSPSMGASSSGSSLADIYQIQIQIAELENNLELQRDALRSASSRFNHLLGRNPEQELTLPDTLVARELTLNTELHADSLVAQNPMLSMTQYELQSLDARALMARRMSYPMIGLGLNYALINPSEMSTSPMNGRDMIMPMLTLTLPIYRHKYKAQQLEINHQKEAAAQTLVATQNALSDQYTDALQSYRDAQRRIKLARRQRQLAEQSLTIRTQSYATTGAQLTDLLSLQQQLLSYQLAELQAIADQNTSLALINRLRGTSPETQTQ